MLMEQAKWFPVPQVRPRDRVLVAGVYLALIALLVVGMDATHLQATFG